MNNASPFPTSATGALPRDEQEPLGVHPSYDDVLDVAVQYTFPCSDPIAVDGCCADIDQKMQREEGQPGGPGMTPGHGEAVTLGEG
jgi:hypothetical protein